MADLDTNETDKDMELEGNLLGTYGSAGSPLYKNRMDVVTNSPSDGFGPDSDDAVNADHSDTGTPDTLDYTLNGTPVTAQLDSTAIVTGRIVFADGSILDDQFVVFQDTAGNVFLTIYDDQVTLDDKGVQSFTINSVDNSSYDGMGQFNRDANTFVACFSDDALILTAYGMVPITDLVVGDMVMTRDNGLQPIRWIGATNLSLDDLTAKPHLCPYKVKSGCFGPGMPLSDLTLSPQHRLLIGGRLMAKMFGDEEMLIAVKHLEKIRYIQKPRVKTGVTYRHILLDRHEVIYANGLPTESLLIGDEARRKLPPELKREIEEILPELACGPAAQPPARVLARGHHARVINERLRRRRVNGRSCDGSVLGA